MEPSSSDPLLERAAESSAPLFEAASPAAAQEKAARSSLGKVTVPPLRKQHAASRASASSANAPTTGRGDDPSGRPLPRLSSFLVKDETAVDVVLKPKKLSSAKKTLGNMLVSIIGVGVLGLPYTFRKSGWLFSLAAMALMAAISYYGMVLLVKTRKLLEEKVLSGALEETESNTSPAKAAPVASSPSTRPSEPAREGSASSSASGGSTEITPEAAEAVASDTEGLLDSKDKLAAAGLLTGNDERTDYFLQITSYGELGQRVMGTFGRLSVDAMVCISQCGFCVAYLIFIGQNVSSVFAGADTFKLHVIICTTVLQILLSWLRSLSRLAPFSIFANAVNLCAYSVIIYYGLCNLGSLPTLAPFTSIADAPAALGVAVYSFEGVGMTLALEGGMKEPSRFPGVLSLGLAVISTAYGLVGLMGYVAFGDQTHQIVTLNLPRGWATTTVKLGLSLALCFTFPVMMHPVYEVYEARLCQVEFVREHILPVTFLRRLMFRSFRGIIVCLVAFVSVGVPHFSTFISLIGSSVCSLLGFVLPAVFHLRVGQRSITSWERWLDYFLVVFGICFAVWGTLDSMKDMFW